MSQYRLNKYQERQEEFESSDKIKSLRGEIGILRITLEEVINKCDTSTDLVMMSHQIGDLATRIEKLVSSCHRLEMSMDMFLDKAAALQFASSVVAVIQKYVTDPDQIDQISNEVIDLLKGLHK